MASGRFHAKPQTKTLERNQIFSVERSSARLPFPAPDETVAELRTRGLELPLKVVQARLGHASIQMTADVYGHLFPRGDDGAELAAAEKAFLNAQV
jgi:integrase